MTRYFPILLVGLATGACGTDDRLVSAPDVPLPPLPEPTLPSLGVSITNEQGEVLFAEQVVLPMSAFVMAPMSAEDSAEALLYAAYLWNEFDGYEDDDYAFWFVQGGDTLWAKHYNRSMSGYANKVGMLFPGDSLWNTNISQQDSVRGQIRVNGTLTLSWATEYPEYEGGQNLRAIQSSFLLQEYGCGALISGYVAAVTGSLGAAAGATVLTGPTAAAAWTAAAGAMALASFLLADIASDESCLDEVEAWLFGSGPPTYRLQYNGCTGSWTPPLRENDPVPPRRSLFALSALCTS